MTALSRDKGSSDPALDDKYAALKARVEGREPGRARKLIDPLWICPGCGSDDLMMHIPSWVTASVDQAVNDLRPVAEPGHDVYERIAGLVPEYECVDCGAKFLDPVPAPRGGSGS
jgi:hypothetical protein